MIGIVNNSTQACRSADGMGPDYSGTLARAGVGMKAHFFAPRPVHFPNDSISGNRSFRLPQQMALLEFSAGSTPTLGIAGTSFSHVGIIAPRKLTVYALSNYNDAYRPD